ncbi:hypothetical protein CLU79DRAFT_226208 [Phycomyces nitens]|nr:hypothetical protein CLU79DRAFT_226208 [Phycomyces nitens]
MMETLLRQSVEMQREFSDKMSQIQTKLRQEIQLKSTLAAKDIDTFFDGFDKDLNDIIGSVRKIDLDFIKNHLGSEHSYILSKRTVTEEMQTRVRSFQQQTMDKTSLFQKEILRQIESFQNSLSNDFQGLDKTIEADAQSSLSQDVKRLQQIKGAKEKLALTQEMVKEINDNVAIMRTDCESGHQRVRRELPLVVSLVESAGARIETEKLELGHFDCLNAPANTASHSLLLVPSFTQSQDAQRSQTLEAPHIATKNSAGPPPEPTSDAKDGPEDRTGDGPKEPSRMRCLGKRKSDSSVHGPQKRISHQYRSIE